MLAEKNLSCDLCVVGGGLSGMCAAISAAREGLKVVLMHERAVLGGNASSEIRMWISGAQGENNRETGIVEEIELENMYRNPTKSYAVWDSILYSFVRREKNITLLLNCTCMDAETAEGNFPHGRTKHIHTVTGYQMTTQSFYKVQAKYFADCSGDSILAPLCGADFRIGREGADEFGEITSAKVADDKTMGLSCLIQGRETHQTIPYLPPEWADKLEDKNFENREPNIYNDAENFWYLELGGNRDTIAETEELRDELLSLATGTWDYIKNSGKFNAENWNLDFLGFLPGKRESRRMCGEYMITQQDISNNVVFADEVAYGGWHLDDHFPDGFFHRGVPNTNYKTPAPYSIPYRTLYSKNVDNLFFAGRNISMTHMAMSSIRVMGTCTLLGEAVGRAAYLAATNNCTPHDVYLHHIKKLQSLLMNADCFLPSKTRAISGICAKAALTGADDFIRNGQDRPHPLYGTDEVSGCCHLAPHQAVTYAFAKTPVQSVRLVFSSDLNRTSLIGSRVERTRSMRSNYRLDQPLQRMPMTLCREFYLNGEKDGVQQELLHVTDNHKRSYNLQLNLELDKLIFVPVSTWGNEKIDLISFDFA